MALSRLGQQVSSPLRQRSHTPSGNRHRGPPEGSAPPTYDLLLPYRLQRMQEYTTHTSLQPLQGVLENVVLPAVESWPVYWKEAIEEVIDASVNDMREIGGGGNSRELLRRHLVQPDFRRPVRDRNTTGARG